MSLDGTPYSVQDTGAGVLEDVEKLLQDTEVLRAEGKLTEATLRDYFGDKRFEQIAASNALEGSTLSVGETQLAVLRGVTITGHDPAYSRDARALAQALDRMHELAQDPTPTDIAQVQSVHALVLGARPGAGAFRTEPVSIRGSDHRPPKTWSQVMDAMEQWEAWSRENTSVPSLWRGVVLHTWLTHIHPYIDGNGRTARALLNLELIRGGLPSVIIRHKDRVRYLDALAHSDEAGDLGPVTELTLERAKDALRDLGRAAARQHGSSETASRLARQQQSQLDIWNDAVKLLYSLLREALLQSFADAGDVRMRWYDSELTLDDLDALWRNDAAGNSWLFSLRLAVPAIGTVEFLAWTGFRSDAMRDRAGLGPGPSIFWSVPDPSGSRRWTRRDMVSPGGSELTLTLPNVDRWVVRSRSGDVVRLGPSDLVEAIVKAVESALTGQ